MPTSGITTWKLPLLVAMICVPIVGGFYVGGPGLGLAVGGMAAAALVVMAVRNPPVYPIDPPFPRDLRRHLLVVLDAPLEESDAIEALAGHVDEPAGDGPDADVLLLAPARHRFLDRWTTDLTLGRERAQRDLVHSSASLARIDMATRGKVGDEDPIQMIEDELRTFPATEVIVVRAPGMRGSIDDRDLDLLGARLGVALHDMHVKSVKAHPRRRGSPQAGSSAIG